MIADVDITTQANDMVARMRAGDVRALARAVSLVEDRAAGYVELLAVCRQYAGTAVRIGVTGPPGAGKSTLVDQMARWLRGQERTSAGSSSSPGNTPSGLAPSAATVGVVAVDPSSPYTGGALLGDRIRMQGFAGDAGVYIRSMASRGALGGLARGVADVCSVMEAAGRDTILIETVGVGQDEVEVVRLADVTVLVLVPGMGDEVQSLKAGVMEVADIFTINKSDREGADRVEQEILAMQGLAVAQGGRVPPVVRTVAISGAGVGELMAAVERVRLQRPGLQRPGLEMLDNLHPGDRTWGSPTVGAGGQLDQVHLDHLGIAVRSIAAARGFYESLGTTVSHEETVEFEQVRTAMLPMGESRIELLEATAEDSVIGRFVAKRGEGLHHIAMRVGDVDAMFRRLNGEGVRLVSDAVRVGAGGHRYFFVHPASTGGVLVEIVGDAV